MSLNLDNTTEGNSASAGVGLEAAKAGSYRAESGRDGKKNWVWVVFWAVIALGFPAFFSGNKELLSLAVFGLIASIGSLGMNVLTGYTGQASLGHGFFLGVGAYASAVIGGVSDSITGEFGLGWSFLLWIPIAGLVAGLIGLLVGPLALRLKGFYLALATVGLIFIGLHIFSNLKWLTGGAGGRHFPAPTLGELNFATGGTLGPIDLNRDQLYYFLVLLVLVISALFVRNLMKSRAGRAFMAVRDREIAAELLGINLARTKLAAFVLSSVLAGICGALYGSYLRYTEPTLWGVNLSIQFIAMVIIGGLASVSGSIIGALLLTAIPQIVEILTGRNPFQLNIFPFVTNEAGAQGLSVSLFNQFLYALFLILFLVFEPRGFMGIYHRVVRGGSGLYQRVRNGLQKNSSTK